MLIKLPSFSYCSGPRRTLGEPRLCGPLCWCHTSPPSQDGCPSSPSGWKAPRDEICSPATNQTHNSPGTQQIPPSEGKNPSLKDAQTCPLSQEADTGLIFPVRCRVPGEPVYTESMRATLCPEEFSSVFSIS